jgi:hypothetical protein
LLPLLILAAKALCVIVDLVVCVWFTQKNIKALEEQLAVLKDRFMFLTQSRKSVTASVRGK